MMRWLRLVAILFMALLLLGSYWGLKLAAKHRSRCVEQCYPYMTFGGADCFCDRTRRMDG